MLAAIAAKRRLISGDERDTGLGDGIVPIAYPFSVVEARIVQFLGAWSRELVGESITEGLGDFDVFVGIEEDGFAGTQKFFHTVMKLMSFGSGH
jgi:hypothetical protein